MRKFILLAPVVLAACATAAAPPPPPAPALCHAENLGQFTGQPASQQLGADMLRASGARTLRWVGHGMMVTMDFSPERLTVWLRPDNRVDRANCG